ncbi:phosphopantetheine-binding protein [Desulfopila inferna]|uniref:phosphopantetheine-binding protein n=1 Tax=Desulfopila inferna TaxID=468528 RepID=UPI001963E587|nr:phosphopantetheine-binding protein [Desulfopila inferna]MBM9605738.1 acyl carrier protein [Desulfopila inferna]
MSEHIASIRSFLFENFLFDAEEDALKNDDSFLEMGIIDSTGVLELVEWLEEEFDIQIEDEELVPENLDSIEQIAAFIQRKKS